MIKRCAGILIPLFSLRSENDFGCGEIADIPTMAQWAASMGHTLIQFLPVDETAPGENSPYSALSVFAIDPIYISTRGLADSQQIASVNPAKRGANARYVDRQAVRAAKAPLLKRAFEKFRASNRDREKAEFEQFLAQERDWLEDYALFRALKEYHEWRGWEQWPEELAQRKPDALRAARRTFASAVEFHSYLQFIAHQQWLEARRKAREQGVILGGDLAFSPGRDSAEVWAHQELFDLTRSVGAPPDAFNSEGQRWGLPVPRWDRMRADGFLWWRSRVRHARALYDVLRIDHVVGLYRTFTFGADTKTPGTFVPAREDEQRAQGTALMRALLEEAGETKLIAEDLGTVPDWVRASLAELGIAGYKVLIWERKNWRTPDETFISPSEYPELAVATTGTHDTSAFATWWFEASPRERASLRDALQLGDSVKPSAAWLRLEGLDAILAALYRAPSQLTIVPIQDMFGWHARINVPGTLRASNWTYRIPLTLERFMRSEAARIRADRLRTIAIETRRFAG